MDGVGQFGRGSNRDRLLKTKDSTPEGSVSFLRHDGWGKATLQAVRLIAQGEIPAFAGMTWVVVGMTWVGFPPTRE